MVELKTVQMTDEELAEKKLHLEYCKLNKEESDLNLKEMEEQLDAKIPTKLLEDDIDRVKENIEKKVVFNASTGEELPATENDVAAMKITLKTLEAKLKADLPMKQLRYKIKQLREAKGRIDAPEQQIKKLEREVRTKSYQVTARPAPTGVD